MYVGRKDQCRLMRSNKSIMGMTSDEEGETSAKTCRSDDSSERPLKKARYVWQIKGKYHLKKPENTEGAKLYIADETRDGYTLHPIEVSHHEPGTQRHDGCTVDLANSSQISKPDPTRVLSPVMSTIHTPIESEDLNPRQLQKWQARQVARCFVDNTINQVLEDMGFIPLPVDADDLMEDFAMSELRRNDEHLEDAAVRMAIHSHGLQRAVADMRGGNQNLNSIAVSDTCIYNFSLDSVGLQNGFINDAVDHVSRWYRPEFCNQKSPQYEQSLDMKHMFNAGFVQEGCSVGTDWNQPGISLKCTSNVKFINSGEMNKITTSCDDSAKDLDSEPADGETTGNSEEPTFTSDMNVGDDDDDDEKRNASFEHTNFMDKAVAVAIQKKGLSTLSSIEYG
ncbi:uncharacterized protein LOC110841376 isoform X2 [Zootermopsis nevadensis]|uniref:uncharacterized protein LOC110841376 isoform X2 n=1 Tax=Zootermopsis nevadensis TaxID=136037 RepID=UPI000B8E629C|nr:uncharacterized protein LOC110841376 isoform X2 [Zootermopsis nevadensis]